MSNRTPERLSRHLTHHEQPISARANKRLKRFAETSIDGRSTNEHAMHLPTGQSLLTLTNFDATRARHDCHQACSALAQQSFPEHRQGDGLLTRARITVVKHAR
jgi:hypothetical protein